MSYGLVGAAARPLGVCPAPRFRTYMLLLLLLLLWLSLFLLLWLLCCCREAGRRQVGERRREAGGRKEGGSSALFKTSTQPRRVGKNYFFWILKFLKITRAPKKFSF